KTGIQGHYLFNPDMAPGITQRPEADHQTLRWYWNPPNKNKAGEEYESYLQKVEKRFEMENQNAKRVYDTCMDAWDQNQRDCGASGKAGAADLGVEIPADKNADGIIDFLAASAPEWVELTAGDGAGAKRAADGGAFVIAGLKSTEMGNETHGHVVV